MASMLLPEVLSPAGLQHIKNHKYVPGKYTPLDNLINPYWAKMAEALPMWLAPNLVTLLGFLPMVISYALAWKSSPDFAQPPSRPLAIFTALALLFYQTMDALDGKQARRTGASSPLGQLFDHGCDCLACLSHHSMAAMLLLPGPSRWSLAGLSALQGCFFLAQWQEYHTGVLNTAFGPVGVTETQFTLMFCGLFVGIAGPENISSWFSAPIQVPWSSQATPLGLAGIQAWCFMCGVLAVMCIAMTLHSTAATGKLKEALLQLVSVVGLQVVMFLWDPVVFGKNSRKVVFLTALLFFWYTAKMILFSMAKMHYPTWQLDTLLPYCAVVVMSRVLSPDVVGYVLTAATVVFGLRVLLWLIAVLHELKEKLNILAFVIQKRE